MPQISIARSASRVIQPIALIASIANGSGQIAVTTSISHGLLSGDIVQALGMATAGADGTYVVSVTGPTTVVLLNSFFIHTAGATGMLIHCGWVAGSIPTPIAPLITSLTTQLEDLSPACSLRVVYSDSIDSNFVTEQPLAAVGAAYGQGAPWDGQYRILAPIPWAALPDLRPVGFIRVKVFLRTAYASATVSSWLS